MKQIYLCIIITLLLALNTYAEDITLKDKGYIKVGGGCIAYFTGEIIFKPQKDVIEVEINDKGKYFSSHLQGKCKPFDNYKITIAKKDIKYFFNRLISLLDSPKAPEHVSTTASEIEIYLPLKSRIIHEKWKELDGKYDVYPLLLEIQDFVYNCVDSKNGYFALKK